MSCGEAATTEEVTKDLVVLNISLEMLEQFWRASIDLLDNLERLILEIEKSPSGKLHMDQTHRVGNP